jgi:hypothetical protein
MLHNSAHTLLEVITTHCTMEQGGWAPLLALALALALALE